MQLRRIAAVSFIAMAATSQAALAQRTTATVYGSVQDASGAVIPNAKVELRHEATGASHPTAADPRGEFTLTFLPVGSYRMEVSAQGFKTYSRTGLSLDAGQQFRLPVVLEVGAQTERITVMAEAPLLENATPAQLDRVTRLQLSELPQARRDFTSLLYLQSGTQSGRDGLIMFNGLATGGASVTVDGVDGSGDTETTSTAMFQNFNQIKVVSQEAIQEVSVSKGVTSAEVARSYSANLNVITKSGSNTFHGSLFELFQNDALNARYAMLAPTAPKSPVRFNQFGGSIGGPVKRDKVFFFATYEGYRQSNFSNLNGLTPTAEFKAAAIRAVPAYKPLLDLYPLPTVPYDPAKDQVALYYGASSNTAGDNHAVARGDYRINDTNSLTLRYFRGRPTDVSPRVMNNPRGYQGMSESANANFIHSAPSWTSETRFGLNLNETFRYDTLHSQSEIPAVEVQGLFDSQGESLLLNGHSYSFEEVIAKTTGRHTLKVGAMHLGRAPGRYDEEVPIFRYGNAADFLANRANRVQFTFGQPRYFGRTWELGLFAQDDLRLTSRLMLNLGVRYEYFSVFSEKNGMLFNPDGMVASNLRPVKWRPADSIYNADKNNFLPRIGFAWTVDPSGKTVVRSGFGMAVAPPNLRSFSGLVYYSPEVPFRFRFTGTDITTLALKYPFTNDQMMDIIKTRDIPKGYSVFDPNNRDPYSMHWSFNVQRQLTATMMLETGYTGNKGLKVTMSQLNNWPDRVTGNRPYAQALESGWRNGADFSYYHAWQSMLRKRTSKGLTFNLNYTWGKVMALAAGDFYPGNDVRVQDENNWRSDLGPARFDITHRFSTDVVYELGFDRWFNAQGGWKQVLGGWLISGIVSARTGDALNIEQRSNRDFSRPDYIGGDPYFRGADKYQFLNPAAFAQVPTSRASSQPLRPGNAGKNNLRGPGSWGTSLSIAKTLSFAERVRLQLRGDAFNALNNVTLGSPQTDITRPTFARITGVGGARSIQLAGRLTF